MTDLIVSGRSARGTVSVPSSKSCTHRALVMAALSEGRSVIRGPLDSSDTRATSEALISMGASIAWCGDNVIVESSGLHASERIIDVGNSGTSMRFITALSSLFSGESVITGDTSVRNRPMGPLLKALEDSGARCSSDNGKAPVHIRGPLTEGRITIDGSESSQFVSSVLIISPLIGRPVDIEVTGLHVSEPYVRMTVRMMEGFGIKVKRTSSGFHVEPQNYVPCDISIPADMSSAAYPLAAGALSGEVTVIGSDPDGLQGDSAIIEILRGSGFRVGVEDDTITCSGGYRPKAQDIDMSDTPDLFPITAVMLSVADGTSRLYGAPHLRFKESDRISSTVSMLKDIGADITETDDGCIINGVGHLKGGHTDHKGDHRLMMAASIASLVSEHPVSMENDLCWNVSYPDFIGQMSSLGVTFDVHDRE